MALQLVGFGTTFAITQTIAAIGFPIIILLLIPVRTFILPKYFTPQELSALDGPTASPFTMKSVGGNFSGEVVANLEVPHRHANFPEIPRQSASVEPREAKIDRAGIQDFHHRPSVRDAGNEGQVESIEMQQPRLGTRRVSRRSASGDCSSLG